MVIALNVNCGQVVMVTLTLASLFGFSSIFLLEVIEIASHHNLEMAHPMAPSRL